MSESIVAPAPSGGGGACYIKTFTAADWSAANTITIPPTEHRISPSVSGAILSTVYALSGSSYTQCWATLETAVTIDASNNVILSCSGGYAGAVVLSG